MFTFTFANLPANFDTSDIDVTVSNNAYASYTKNLLSTFSESFLQNLASFSLT
jgi:hypothetical protein